MLYKNTGSQHISILAYYAPSNAAATGMASYITCGYSIDGAASGQLTNTNPTEIGRGVYTFSITANESNGDHILIVPISSTGSIYINPKEYFTRSTLPTVNVTQIGGSTTAADNVVLDYNGVGYSKANSSIGTTSNLTNKGGFQLATSGMAYVTGYILSNVGQINGSTTVVTNVSNDYNGTGYAKSASSIGLATLTTTTTNLTNKGGFQLATSGLEYITATVPTGLASTFPTKLNQLHYRLFGRVRVTATGLYVESGDGSTIYTTQLVTDDGIKQIIDDAT